MVIYEYSVIKKSCLLSRDYVFHVLKSQIYFNLHKCGYRGTKINNLLQCGAK